MRWLRITVIALLACVVIAGAWALVGPDGALRTRPVAVENAITSGTAAYPSLDFTPAVAVAETVSLPATRTLADFDAGRARDHAAAIAAMGVRREGGSRERRAASYIRAKLESWGYEVGTQRVPLPGSAVSINVVAVREGVSARRKVLGAHIDSKSPSPGANDNASGTGVVLELARVFSERRPAHTTVFAFFGAEEMWDSNPDHHHYGSRRYVRGLSSSERDEIVGMVSVDMVGRGTGFTSRTMGRGTRTVDRQIRSLAARQGVSMTYVRDEGRYGWSDHEPFELAGIPATWIEWRPDPYYHTSRDTASRLQERRLRTTGRVLQAWVSPQDEAPVPAVP